MQKYKIVISVKAQQEISETYEYISQSLNNADAADNLLDALHKKLNLLKTTPKMCPTVEFIGFKNTFRKCVVKNFIAFYVIKEEIKEVYVARFYYGRKDY
jgi:plasmid stabilization system protein ParE